MVLAASPVVSVAAVQGSGTGDFVGIKASMALSEVIALASEVSAPRYGVPSLAPSAELVWDALLPEPVVVPLSVL